MSTLNVIIVAGCVVLTVPLSLALVGRFRRQSCSVPPLLLPSDGAFLRLVAARIGTPDDLLIAVHSERPPAEAIDRTKASGGSGQQRIDSASPPTDRNAKWVTGAAAIDATWPGLDVWWRWKSVDDHVFQAFEQLSHDHVGGLADLLNLVDAKQYAIGSAGFHYKLLGHVGEWHVREHLDNAGAAVVMPRSTNEPGLDLWADGHAINVKTVADAGAAASQHFADYPGIPIIVPSDAVHIPTDALHFGHAAWLSSSELAEHDHLTIVDDALSHADIAENTSHATDVLQDSGAHLHFPLVTMAVSGFREGRLVANGSTNLARAAKNVVVDTAAVGGGGAIGMKAGALAGTVFGPVGTVIGGIAGGILGAFGGRAAAKTIKRAPLEAAKLAYEATVSQYSSEESTLEHEHGS